jgi:hypothetical protein
VIGYSRDREARHVDEAQPRPRCAGRPRAGDAGPEPETPADPEANIIADGLQQREREQERIKSAFPEIEP